MSSLANQLQAIASVDAARLGSRTGAPSSKSYLFSAKVAAQQDLDEVFALGQAGFDELLELDPEFAEFEDELFSDSAKRNDRTQLNREENDALDTVLERCLRRLGRWIGTMAGGKCIEWLVRRFRVHEMNAECLLQVFLPYHESPNFARMLAILTLPTASVYHAPFAPLIKNAQPVPRAYIVQAISPAREPSLRLLQDVVNLPKHAFQEGCLHRALLSFWSAALVELIEKGKAAKGVDGLVKTLVESFIDLLAIQGGGEDINAAVYPPLITLTRAIRLADEPFLAILEALLSPKSGANVQRRIMTLLLLLQDRPGWKLGLGENASEKLAKIKRAGSTMVALMEKHGFEVAFETIITVLCSQPELHQKTLARIVESVVLSQLLVVTTTNNLLSIGSSTETSESERVVCKSLLASLRERHPATVDAAFVAASSSSTTASTLLTAAASTSTSLADVYSADASSRVQGIKRALQAIEDQSGTADEKIAAKTALVARLSDDEVEIIRALYSSPSALLAAITPTEYVDAVEPSFVSERVRVPVVSLHVAFIRDHLLEAHPNASNQVFERLVFPTALVLKHRETDLIPWLTAGLKYKGRQSILERISNEYRQSRNKRKSVGGGDDGVEHNEMVVRLLANAYGASTASLEETDHLLQQLTSSNPGCRNLALLVVTQLLAIAQPEKRTEIAARSLHILTDPLAQVSTLPIEAPVESLGKMAFKHPKSPRTEAALIGGLFVALKEVKAPIGHAITWMAPAVSKSDFRDLAIRLYTLIHSGFLSTKLSADLLRHLFTQLGHDSLLFFASIWTVNSSMHLKVAALKHGTAFVKAHSSGTPVDFQMVIPALVVALQDGERSVRESAAGLLRSIVTLQRVPTTPSSVYSLDEIYGPKSKKVQLLRSSDLAQYLQVLESAADDMIIDPTRLSAIHSTELSTSGKGKKDVQHRRAIIASLLSHVVAWHSVQARLSIMGSLAGVHDSSVLRGILPILTPLLSPKSDEYRLLTEQNAVDHDRYLQTLVNSINKQSVSVLADADGEAWKGVLWIISGEATSSVFASKFGALLLGRIADGVFDALAQAQKVPLVRGITQSLRTLSTDEALASRSILSRLSLAPEDLVLVLHDLASPLDPQSTRKRQKQDSVNSDRVDEAVLDITALIESRDWPSVPGDANLVAALMEVLSNLLAKKQNVHEGLDYLEQELLAGILSNLEKISDKASLQKAHVGIEVIIKVIRASSNPRTSQRALLVAAELARLIPEAVLHNVMPIFTFMGAADFQRDDAYSFGVVEKTVSRIVPVMTRALHGKHKERLGLYKESEAFLGIFTDMVGRLPKHRTLPFFVHLVKSLGEEFLPAVLMLLLERGSRRPGTSSEMALGLCSAFELPARLDALQEIINESSRLLLDLSADAEQRHAFLSHLLSEEDGEERILVQLAALLEFERLLADSLARKACDQAIIREVVLKLIVLSSAAGDHEAIRRSAIGALGATMQLLAAGEFLAVVRDILAEQQSSTSVAALEIYTSRITAIKKEARTTAGPIISDIIKSCGANLSDDAKLGEASLEALKATISSALPSEDSAIAADVPKLVNAIKQSSGIKADALGVLDITIKHLGPRIIPHIQSILDTLLPLCITSDAKAGTAILRTLILTVPTFVSSKQLTASLQTGLGMRAESEKLAKALWHTITDKINTKALFPVLMDLWKTIDIAHSATMEGYFHLLQLTLRNASDGAINTLIKPVFAFFLDVFDLRHRLGGKLAVEVVDGIEGSAIGSFLALVTKLNETNFKPLFTRLYDWAVIDLAAGKSIDDKRLIERKIVLLHVMMGLLDKFKHLLSPYIGILLPHIEELLASYRDEEITDPQLWTLLLGVLARSFEVDDGAYWTESLFRRLIPLLVAQIPLFPALTTAPDSPIASCLAALAGGTTSEPVLKSLNSSVCLLTRKDDVGVRLAALSVLDAMWANGAEEMIGLVPETVSEFLAELIEDESSEVESLARGVLARIEKTTGSLKEYLE